MLDLTFLTEEQIFGDGKLEIFEKYGTKCAITDFSILLGGFVSLDKGNSLKNRAGWWWTKTPFDDAARVVSDYGNRGWSYVDRRSGGARPALPYSSIESISSNRVRGKGGIKEILYGEYPQWVVAENYSCELEKAYNSGNIRKTGKSYTTDSVVYDYDTVFRARQHAEYEYNGSKYIRFVGDLNCVGEILSDGRKIESGKPYWVRVEPITWLVDGKNDVALPKFLLFAGLVFNHQAYSGSFENTDIKRFMDKYFSKEIVASANILNTSVNITIDSTDSIDDIFNEAINRMNEINGAQKTKVLK